MKKIASILILVFAFTLTTQAQKKRGDRENREDRGPKLTTEQQTTLAVKKMTLVLDLTDKQQKQITPILMAKMADRKASMEKRKEANANKEKRERPSADEMYAMQIARLDNQILMKNKMKEILNKEQFEKFEKMKKGRKGQKGKEKDKKMMKDHKGDKRSKRDNK